MHCTRASSRLAVAVTVALSACEAAGPAPPPPLSDQLFLFAFLTPDVMRQRIQVSALDQYTRPDLSGVRARIYKQGKDIRPEWTLVAEWDSASAAAVGVSLTDWDQCRTEPDLSELTVAKPPSGISSAGGLQCLTPEVRLEAGATYRVEATADGRAPARGETTIPGPFQIERAVLTGEAGTHSLSAEWTSSVAVHRYLVAIRKMYGFCPNCFKGWSRELQDTRFAGDVPQMVVDSAGAVPMLDVAAVDEHLHAYVTTGHRGALHAVHPVQNVRGGMGVVGSLRIRSRAIDRK